MGVETVSLIIAAFVSGSLGIASLMRNFRSRLCVAFAAISLLLFTHDALSVIERFQTVMRFASPRLHTLSVLFLGPATLVFLQEIVPPYYRKLRGLLWVYPPIFAAVIFAMALPSYLSVAGWILILSHLFLLFPAAIWVTVLYHGREKSSLSREQVRLRYAFWGGSLTLAVFLTDALAFAGLSIPPLGTFARVLYLIYLFQTFIQKEVVTADEVAAKLALFGGVAVTLATIYTLLVSWVGDQPGLFFFNTLIASFVILVLFDPIRKLTSRVTRKLFLTENVKLEEALNALSRDLMGSVMEPPELVIRIHRTLAQCLGVPTSALYILQRDGLSYLRLESQAANQAGAELSASSPLIEYMTLRRARPFVLETIESDRDSFHENQPRRFCQACVDTMRTIKADFILPFLSEGRIIGFSATTTGERILLSNEQLRSFIPISRQIASVLRNAQTFTTLRDRDKLAAVGEMAAGLAHEIKNPLGAIKGAAEILREQTGVLPQEPKEFLDIIVTEVNRLSTVVTDFLDYARPRRYQPYSSCDPVRVAEHTASLCLRDQKIRFELVSDKPSYQIDSDPEILKQVLLNLFLNAVHAMENHPKLPALTVRIREIRPSRLFLLPESLPIYKTWEGWEPGKNSPQHPFISISVEDNGDGIPTEDREKIFTPFFTTKQKGTGLGLAICQRLIEGMGGSIAVKANNPRGTIFTIHLPIRREETRESNSLNHGKSTWGELNV